MGSMSQDEHSVTCPKVSKTRAEAGALASTSSLRRQDRRGFFRLGAAAAGGAVLATWVGPESDAAANTSVPRQVQKQSTDDRLSPGFFVEIGADNSVTVVINRLEFGQGVATALAMILAEELDYPPEKMLTRLGGNVEAYKDPVMGLHLTGGSSSIRNSYGQYRRLGALARHQLVQAAAARWGVAAESLRTEQGSVVGGARRASYGELAADAAAVPLPAEVPLKDPAQFRVIGQPLGRHDNRSVVDGSKVFGIDVRRPGQLFALVVRAPTCGMGQVKTFDGTASSQVKGVKGVFKVTWGPLASGVAIVAESFWAAKQARDVLSVVFDEGPSGSQATSTPELFAEFRRRASEPALTALAGAAGFSVSSLEQSPQKLVLEYEFPYLAHAAMEPLNATVDLRGDSCEIWTGTQMPGVDAAAAAAMAGLDSSQVKLHCLPAGGGFGRRAVTSSDFVSLAVAVAKAWRGLGGQGPLQVLWTREDDMTGGYYRPMHFHRAELGFDSKGALLAWDHVVVGQSIMEGAQMTGPSTASAQADRLMVGGLIDNIYGLPLRVRADHPRVPVPVLWWRSVEHTHNAYVIETVIDECSRRAGMDPVAYRLARFGPQHSRHRAALELAVKKARYGSKKLIPGRAWGVAVHESFETVVAYIVEVSLEGEGPKKRVVVQRVTAGVHCNLVVNPLSAAAQVEGGFVYGLTGFLPGSAITLDKGKPQQDQFSSFRVPRMSDCPTKVDIHFVPSKEPPTGLGEPGLPPYLPAVANALAKLSGRIPTQLPLQDFV